MLNVSVMRSIIEDVEGYEVSDFRILMCISCSCFLNNFLLFDSLIFWGKTFHIRTPNPENEFFSCSRSEDFSSLLDKRFVSSQVLGTARHVLVPGLTATDDFSFALRHSSLVWKFFSALSLNHHYLSSALLPVSWQVSNGFGNKKCKNITIQLARIRPPRTHATYS